MKSYNNVTLIGKVCKNCDIKQDDSNIGAGSTRATFSLAVERSYKNSEGKHACDFFQVVACGKLAKICDEYLKKDCLILVTGQLQSRSYESSNETRWITEVVMDSMNVMDYART